MRTRASLCLLMSLACLAAPAMGSDRTAVPAIVQLAAQTAAAEYTGILVHERHISIRAQLGPVHFTNDNDAVLLMTDGVYRHVHFTRMLENGHPVGAEKLAQRESSDNADLANGNGAFHQPFDLRYTGEYTFTAEPAAPVSSGSQTLHFTSTYHDVAHGAGTMVIDPSSGRVLSLNYTPYVLPQHADSGTVSETFGQALPGLWTIVRIDSVYTGHAFLVSGRGTVTEVLDNFHRFSDPDAGLAFYRTALR